MKSLVCTLWGSLLIFTTSSFGELNEAVGPTWIANNQWAKGWDLSWQWTWCFWLGFHYLCWSLASCCFDEAIPLPLLLILSTSLSVVSRSCSFYLLNSTIYSLLSPDSPSWGPSQHSPHLLWWPLPWSLNSSLMPHSLHPSFHYHSIVSKKQTWSCAQRLKFLHWLLNVNKIKSEILSREYQTL